MASFTGEFYCLLSERRGEVKSVLPASSISHVPLAQSNFDVRVGTFQGGVFCYPSKIQSKKIFYVVKNTEQYT